MENKISYKLSDTWIERIFARLTEIYGERFTCRYSQPQDMERVKLQWRAGLYGLSVDEIKKVLNMCLNNIIKDPPNMIDFFHYARSYKVPMEPKPPIPSGDPEVAKHFIKEIKDKLKYGNRINTTVPNGAECQ